jgi:hypothetical protein
MSKKKASRSEGGSKTPPPGESSRGTTPTPTPHRPVISLALVLFVPALLLVLHGNLSVQTALFRFIGALLVSWVAARLVFATLSSYARSANSAPAAATGGSAGAAAATDLSGAGSTRTGASSLSGADIGGPNKSERRRTAT